MSDTGYIRDPLDLKIFILYILRQLGLPSPADEISAIAMTDGCVDYFAVSDALSGLLSTGHIAKNMEYTEHYILTPEGEHDLTLYESRLPPSLKKDTAAAALKAAARMRAEASVRCELVVKGENHYVQRCLLLDGEDEILRLEMLVTSVRQAGLLERNFKKNAARIYNGVLSAMTAEYEK